MGGKQSSSARARAYSSSGEGPVVTSNGGGVSVTAGTSSGNEPSRTRTRSLSSVMHEVNGHPIVLSPGARTATTSSENSSPDSPRGIPTSHSRFMHAQSLPVHLFSLNALKCPVCNKFIQPDEIECHLVMCLTKPRIHYNEDVLSEDKGECVICLDDLLQGDTIARLPCLCIYHKTCIDSWFKKNRSCPEHPND